MQTSIQESVYLFSIVQVAQVAIHACKLFLQSKAHQRHNTILALHHQTPADLKTSVSKVCYKDWSLIPLMFISMKSKS